MNLPEHITRQQITDAFNILGLDAGEVLSWSGHGRERWICLEMRPRDAHPNIDVIRVSIPIVEHAPEPDLVALARQEARG